MNDRPLMEFDSHVAGKNAMVRLWPDRVEWGKSGWMSTGAKVGLGLATAGMSMLATGVRGKHEDNSILIRSISSVTTKKSGLTKNEVNVVTSGGVVSFRCSQAEAEKFKALLLQQIANGGMPPTPPAAAQPPPPHQQTWQQPMPPQQPPAPPAPAPPAAPSADDVMAQLEKLGKLRDAGIVSEEEFAAKKAELLARL